MTREDPFVPLSKPSSPLESSRLSMFRNQSRDEDNCADDTGGKVRVNGADESPEIRTEDVDALFDVAEEVRSLEESSGAG
jgi:hypothetical protein